MQIACFGISRQAYQSRRERTDNINITTKVHFIRRHIRNTIRICGDDVVIDVYGKFVELFNEIRECIGEGNGI